MGDKITNNMDLKIITCICGNQYPSRKDPNSQLKHERPQCGKCGQREYKRTKK